MRSLLLVIFVIFLKSFLLEAINSRQKCTFDFSKANFVSYNNKTARLTRGSDVLFYDDGKDTKVTYTSANCPHDRTKVCVCSLNLQVGPFIKLIADSCTGSILTISPDQKSATCPSGNRLGEYYKPDWKNIDESSNFQCLSFPKVSSYGIKSSLYKLFNKYEMSILINTKTAVLSKTDQREYINTITVHPSDDYVSTNRQRTDTGICGTK